MSVIVPQGVRRIGPEEHKRRNNLVVLCQIRLALRLLYFCSLNLRGQLFCYPPVVVLSNGTAST